MVIALVSISLPRAYISRQYVAALNGLAGLDIIQEKFADAAENYREVLRSATGKISLCYSRGRKGKKYIYIFYFFIL